MRANDVIQGSPSDVPTARRALVGAGPAPADRRAAAAVVRTLVATGWDVVELPAGASAVDVVEMAERGRVEMVVLPGGAAARLAEPAYSALRALPDPPLLVACGRRSSPGPLPGRQMRADVDASTLADLLAVIDTWLPGPGRRRWGVGMARHGARLHVTPTGALDVSGAGRLVEVLDSRAGTYEALVLDLRHLAAASPAGLSTLTAWPPVRETTWLAGPLVRDGLAAVGLVPRAAVVADESGLPRV